MTHRQDLQIKENVSGVCDYTIPYNNRNAILNDLLQDVNRMLGES